MSIQGHVDVVAHDAVQGWACNLDDGEDRLLVEVSVDGRVVASAVAQDYRQDLEAAGLGDGRHGFLIALDNADGTIVCKVGETQLEMSQPASKAHKAGEFWDTLGEWRPKMAPRIRWPESPHILRDHNTRVCGRDVGDQTNQGLMALIKDLAGGSLPFPRAVSVGCGPGQKEMTLLQEGIASYFDLYDVSAGLLRAGEGLARELNLADRLSFIHGYDFERDLGRNYDMVYWDNALHHMFDADAAVRWSYDVLRPGGWFVMADYVGANRFQWPDHVYATADLIRGSLPDSCFVNPVDPDSPYSRGVHRPTLQDMEYDPSEAADSEAIIPAIGKYFPDALIRHVGGTAYHLALNDVLTNLPEESPLLDYILRLDRNIDVQHYAVALAQKPA